MSRHVPEPGDPATTVVVVMAYELVATSTPGAISVSRLTWPVYHPPTLQEEGQGSSRTGSDSRPWISVLGRQRSDSAGTASRIEPNLASSPPNAISASSRASGAPRQ